jgi:probable rRNA maturation factor
VTRRGAAIRSERSRSLYRPPWRIDLTVRADVRTPVPLAALGRLVSSALEAARAPTPGSIGLILSGDEELAELNRAHLGTSGPTDVLSFPLLPAEAFGQDDTRRGAAMAGFRLPPGSRVHLGDIVVSVERAIEQASTGHGGQTSDVRWSSADELRLLVVHGVLHVCGWDHAEPVEEAAMRTLEARLLA